MRKFSQINAKIVPFCATGRAYHRRPLSSVVGHLTVLMLFKHSESATEILVSDDGSAIGAVWVPKVLVSIASPERGRFLVATISAKLARDKGLGSPLIDRAGFTAAERADLDDAITTAARSRKRLCGYQEPMGWSGGRNVFA